MAPPTILAHKSSFLTAQTLQLSQSLTPSATWRASNSQVAEGGLPDRLVDEVLYRANHVLLQHARRVYAPQASRHVAEQIEALYLEAAEKAVRGNGAGVGGGGGEEEEDGDEGRERGDEGARFLRVGADFASDDVVAALPSTWDLHSATQAAAHPAEANRYADLASTLTSLATQRKEASSRLERLRRMRGLLAPLTSFPTSASFPPSSSSFSASTSAPPPTSNVGGVIDAMDGIDKVQPNLVTREGELEKELERMRVLLVRVAGRVAQLPDAGPGTGEDTAMEDLEAIERGKVEKLLDEF
ncbi:kinetochore Sim4 complex subunit Fta4 [Annulohypoxylon maeteangense]|uniref:kinetochore Sim4 complex subunit Fta4 n=1 Tax=Annulohypoxylon maeteangense TaxID=1927788 RepID=UPI002007B853|nr:kinetochore Sim4 complex subunit Fta4 [Annulohypoxylon maeteangense]KAI0880646.1 kinetochore Sim4 complex subunit Fta4 [Annulohypoxylon maeteangense]